LGEKEKKKVESYGIRRGQESRKRGKEKGSCFLRSYAGLRRKKGGEEVPTRGGKGWREKWGLNLLKNRSGKREGGGKEVLSAEFFAQ